MNTKDKNINNAAGSRRTYLSPRTEVIKMDTNAGMMENWSMRREPGLNGYDANGKRWQGDLDSWDEADGSNDKNWGSGW